MRWACLFIALLAACGDDGAPSDAGGGDAGPDAGLPDAGPGDAGWDAGVPDAGPPPRGTCAPCRRDADCGGPDDLCVVLADGERACGVACATDAECDAIGEGLICRPEVDGLPWQCRPERRTCIVSAPGSACDGACEGTYDRCVDAEGLGAVCTAACEVDADCPIGMRRCRATADGRVCVPDEASPAARCAALAERLGVPTCDDETPCDEGSCRGSGALRLCLSATTDGRCPDGMLAAPDPAGGEACVPHGALASRWAGLDCACVLEDPGSMLDDTAALLGLSRCDMSFTDSLLRVAPEISRDPWRLGFTDRALGHWPAAVTLGEAVARALDDAADSDRPVAASLAVLADLSDQPVADPAPPGAGSLVDALEAWLRTTAGAADRADLEAQVGRLDASLAAALAPIVVALEDAHAERERALRRVGDQRARYFGSTLSVAGLSGMDMRRSDDRGAIRGDVEVDRMAAAAVRLAAAIEDADLSRFEGVEGDLTVESPAGRLAVRGGAGRHTYGDDDWHATALLVELGGDDIYRFPAGATATVDNGVAVVIDVAGADLYAYDEVPHPRDEGPEGHVRLASDADGRSDPAPGVEAGPSSRSTTARQGAGRLGIGLLFDLGDADDVYRSPRMSQGYAWLGVGALYDAGGDDTYHAEAYSQGAAEFGVALLLDAGGGDRYTAYHGAQGYAYARAVGALVDARGDDVYFMHPSDVLYWSPQDPGGSNSTLGQGAGFGRRADFTPDRTFMSGGLGVLRDRAGADRYTAGIFAQATGYWYGAGLLVDSAGDDHYDGQWYVQSGAAHFGVSALIEGGGADTFNATARRQNVAIGGGHDFSASVFVDRAGDDDYRAPGLSFGTGNDGGAGLFFDAAGDDRYDATNDRSFGNASAPPDDSFRVGAGTYGLFMDADGADTHARPTVEPVGNDAEWTQRIHEDAGEQGAGIDREGGRLGI